MRLRISADAPSRDWVVAGKLVQDAADDLVNWGLNGALVLVLLDAGALEHTRVSGVAVVDDVLEDISVPAGHEIGVPAVSGAVTRGEDEGLGSISSMVPSVLEEGSVPVDLHEEMGHVDLILSTVLVAAVNTLGPVHVVLVVLQVGILLQARGEMDVHPKRRGVTVAVSEGEANTGTRVVGAANTGSGAVRVYGPRGAGGILVVSGDLLVTGAGDVDVADFLA